MMNVFWVIWCVFFFVFDVLVGIADFAAGLIGFGIFSFVMAAIMVALGMFWVDRYLTER